MQSVERNKLSGLCLPWVPLIFWLRLSILPLRRCVSSGLKMNAILLRVRINHKFTVHILWTLNDIAVFLCRKSGWSVEKIIRNCQLFCVLASVALCGFQYFTSERAGKRPSYAYRGVKNHQQCRGATRYVDCICVLGFDNLIFFANGNNFNIPWDWVRGNNFHNCIPDFATTESQNRRYK